MQQAVASSQVFGGVVPQITRDSDVINCTMTSLSYLVSALLEEIFKICML